MFFFVLGVSGVAVPLAEVSGAFIDFGFAGEEAVAVADAGARFGGEPFLPAAVVATTAFDFLVVVFFSVFAFCFALIMFAFPWLRLCMVILQNACQLFEIRKFPVKKSGEKYFSVKNITTQVVISTTWVVIFQIILDRGNKNG